MVQLTINFANSVFKRVDIPEDCSCKEVIRAIMEKVHYFVGLYLSLTPLIKHHVGECGRSADLYTLVVCSRRVSDEIDVQNDVCIVHPYENPAKVLERELAQSEKYEMEPFDFFLVLKHVEQNTEVTKIQNQVYSVHRMISPLFLSCADVTLQCKMEIHPLLLC
jgi:hypothetical protein